MIKLIINLKRLLPDKLYYYNKNLSYTIFCFKLPEDFLYILYVLALTAKSIPGPALVMKVASTDFGLRRNRTGVAVLISNPFRTTSKRQKRTGFYTRMILSTAVHKFANVFSPLPTRAGGEGYGEGGAF
jgi:hypothetical protein